MLDSTVKTTQDSDTHQSFCKKLEIQISLHNKEFINLTKISDGKYKIDGATNASDTLKLAGEIIPEVGSILVKLSEIMELAEEKQITDKLKKISLLVPDESRSIISEYVASKLTLKRRKFIQELKMDELKF